MPVSPSPRDFVARWRHVTANERKIAQEHFIDLCRLIGHPTPLEADPDGVNFTFEAGAGKSKGGYGYAGVWKRGFFTWEYKGKHADLGKAYRQLLQYREAWHNPPLLIVSDIVSRSHCCTPPACSSTSCGMQAAMSGRSSAIVPGWRPSPSTAQVSSWTKGPAGYNQH